MQHYSINFNAFQQKYDRDMIDGRWMDGTLRRGKSASTVTEELSNTMSASATISSIITIGETITKYISLTSEQKQTN